MKKKMTVSKMKNKVVWPVFSRFIRLRDCLETTKTPDFGLCCCCGKRYPFKSLHAGHFIQGRHNANLFEETGCHAQCYYDNIQLSGNVLVYRRFIINKYGEGYDLQLEENNKQIKSFTIPELEQILFKYKYKIKELEG